MWAVDKSEGEGVGRQDTLEDFSTGYAGEWWSTVSGRGEGKDMQKGEETESSLSCFRSSLGNDEMLWVRSGSVQQRIYIVRTMSSFTLSPRWRERLLSLEATPLPLRRAELGAQSLQRRLNEIQPTTQPSCL